MKANLIVTVGYRYLDSTLEKKKNYLIPSLGRSMILPYFVKVVATVGSTSGAHFFYTYTATPLTKTCWVGVWGTQSILF